MGGPYLKSGETIVLTTSRISADTVLYDVMLTTERLFLIDNRNARFEPGIVDLSTILSVQGGKTPAQVPVITLVFRPDEKGSTREPLTLVFTQGLNENRRTERDEWVRTLIQLSIRWIDRAVAEETPPEKESPVEKGLRPAIRHGNAPEMVRPLSNVVDENKIQAPDAIIPEAVEGSGEIPVFPPVKPLVIREEPLDDPEPDTITPAILPPEKPAQPLRVTMPEIFEEEIPGRQPSGSRAPEPTGGFNGEALFRTIPTAFPSLTVTEERAPAHNTEDVPVTPSRDVTPTDAGHEEVPGILRALRTGTHETMPLPEDPHPPVIPEREDTYGYDENPGTPGLYDALPEEDTEQEPDAVPSPDEEFFTEPDPGESPAVHETYQEENVPIPSLDSDTAGVSIKEESPGAEPENTVLTEDVPVDRDEPAGESPAGEIPCEGETGPGEPHGITGNCAVPPGEPVPERPEAGQDSVVGEPTGSPVQDREPEKVNPPADALPFRHPIPPAYEIRPSRVSFTFIAILLIVVVLIAAAAMLFLVQQPPGQDNIQVTPVPATVTAATTLPLKTTLTVTPTITITPEKTTVAPPAPSPSPASLTIPQEGVWVMISSESGYSGNVGNAGQLRQVSASGNSLHRIFWSDRPVQISIQKNDTTGAVLTATVYRNGTAIISRSITAPRGMVEILIDPVTAEAPGMV